MARPWKLILLLTGIFLAGGVTGGFLTLRFGRELWRRETRLDEWAPARLRLLNQRLHLTPEQVERLKPIMRRDMEALGKVRAQSLQDARAIIERMERDIAAVLTPDQRTEFERLSGELRERTRRMFEQRQRPARPPGPGGDGPRGGRGPRPSEPGERAQPAPAEPPPRP